MYLLNLLIILINRLRFVSMKNLSSKILLSAILLPLLLMISCGKKQESATLFTKISSDSTGVSFNNQIDFNKDFNIYTYRNFYDGGGVAVGDLSGNGLPDLYFTSNMGDNKLYFNRGNFKFEDVTDQAGVAGTGKWSTGVSLADINGDRLLDIYVTNSGDLDDRRNELFINNGDGTFTESAAQYGLDDAGYSIHATFFDYNGDGYLDLYLINNEDEPIDNFELSENFRQEIDFLGGDRLFRNDGETFTDVTEEAGIFSSIIGFALSATVSDINRDGLPDLFIANDFFERDYLYINQGDGTFDEIIRDDVMRSMSAASMGSDIADLDNNGWTDIFVLDMLPEDEKRLKVVTTFESPELYNDKVNWDYGHQFTRNVLHVNNGLSQFVEIGRYSNLQATDWSWAVLMADFDHNGYNDIFVTNGLLHDITNLDYLTMLASPEKMRDLVIDDGEDFEKFIDIIPSNPISNHLFHNEGNFQFSDRTAEWGVEEPGFSNGAAWADLNGDGSLELIVNNVNESAWIYQNRTTEMFPERTWLRVDMHGDAPNTQAIGAQLQVWAGDQYWFREHFLQRGFQSSVEPGLHVGLGETARIDSLVLRWPDGRTSRLNNLDVPARITLSQSESTSVPAPSSPPVTLPGDLSFEQGLALLTSPNINPAGLNNHDLNESSGETQPPTGQKVNSSADPSISPTLMNRVELGPITEWSHRRYDYSDFTRERLLLHMRSTEGPALCTGDITGNGLSDIYTGGARDQSGVLWVQNEENSFISHQTDLFAADAGSEDTACAFFDANGDGLDDLYVVSGGNSFSSSSALLIDRFYLNNGQGLLRKSSQLLPTVQRFDSGSVVAAHDFTGDGTQDIFVGTRLRPFAVGLPVNGYLLEGDGQGNFKDVTEEWAPILTGVGMITDALWADLTGDGASELVIAGEWMPIRVFANRGDRFEEITNELDLSNTTGWWNAIAAGDLNGDGRIDLVGANHGLNSLFKASGEEPVKMWVGDFARNGMIEQILSYPKDGINYPVALLHDLTEEIPALREKYPDYQSYAGQSIDDIFSVQELSQMLELNAVMLSTAVFWNRTEGMQPENLPMRAQLAPMYGITLADLTGNGLPEIIIGGNLYDVKPQAGPYDASRSVVITYHNDELQSIPPQISGLNLNGEIRKIVSIERSDQTTLLFSRFNEGLGVFKLSEQ